MINEKNSRDEEKAAYQIKGNVMDIVDGIDNRDNSVVERQSFKTYTNVWDPFSGKRNNQNFSDTFIYITFSLVTLNQLYL